MRPVHRLRALLLASAIVLANACAAGAPETPAPASAPATASALPVNRRDVVSRVADILRAGYANEALGNKLADGLQAQSDRLAQVVEPAAFVRAMTLAMQAQWPDLHLYLTYEPERQFVPGATDAAATATDANGTVRAVVRSGRIDGRDQQALARSNFAYEGAERLAGNIGYVRLSRFVPLAFSRATAQAACDFIANSDAVVIDLRGNIGGAPDAVAFLLSHFFAPGAAPVLLHSAVSRSQGRSDRVMTDPAAGNAALALVPLYVLIDKQSASAAEMFAYAVQRLGRGKVIGETSAGAGNGGRKFSVGQGFAMFLPEWTSTNGPGWEGSGVRPDIAVAAGDDARQLAHRLALRQLAASAGQSAALKEERERILATLPPTPTH